MDAPDLTALSATEIVARVHDGRTSAVAVAGAHLARIAERDRHLGAFQEHDPERVLAEAGAVDRRADRFALPLAGVPVAIKDCVDVAGYPTRHGSAATDTTPARRDDELVKRLRAAGAVVIGKTRMPELAIWGFTHSALGTTRNPLDPALDPGGSSGGAAAAVAAGMAALALGTDGGGSIRIPAAYCGLVGVKPGAGRRPADGRRGRALVRDVGGGAARAHRRGRRAHAGVLAGRSFAVDAPGRVHVGPSLAAPLPFTRPRPDHRAAAVGAAARLRAAPGGPAVTLAAPPGAARSRAAAPTAAARWSGVQPRERQRRGQRQRHVHRPGCVDRERPPGEHREHQRRVGRRARERARRRQPEPVLGRAAGQRHLARPGLEPDQPAVRRGDADRAAAVRAQGQRRHPGRDRRRAAAAGAAGVAGRVQRVAGGAERRVGEAPRPPARASGSCRRRPLRPGAAA